MEQSTNEQVDANVIENIVRNTGNELDQSTRESASDLQEPDFTRELQVNQERLLKKLESLEKTVEYIMEAHCYLRIKVDEMTTLLSKHVDQYANVSKKVKVDVPYEDIIQMYSQGITAYEIGKTFGIPQGTVINRLKRNGDYKGRHGNWVRKGENPEPVNYVKITRNIDQDAK
ncbi:MAG: hypothetical protein A2Y24_06745 [Clostridiales bacterium GWE2_32_10]|nr:MAG: hypothetical protein A2Y24_06745 [Clostridiales bacterium GWE2_32_10]HBY20992.1 hypothetical protein [Clostridiales bacterium]